MVRTDDATLAVGQALPGRGAHLCPDPVCVERAGRRGAMSRALRGPVTEAAVARLGEEIAS